MPTAAGPNTKGEENLVFAYDLGDVSNSYKGEPTTNFIAELGDPTQEITRGEFGQYYNLVDIFETHGLVPYTLSMDIKGNIPGSCLVYMQNSSYTKYAFPLGSVNITTEWQRFFFRNRTPSGPTSAWQTNTPNDNRAMLATYTGYGSGRNPTVRNMQLELGAHETPFTAGTRSATQGLLDLTGNSTIDLTNVSFDSSAQMTFDGTDDRATVADPGYPSSGTDPFTLEIIYKVPTGATWYVNGSGTALIGRGSYQGSIGIFRASTEGNVKFWIRLDGGNIYDPGVTGLSRDDYHHIVGTFDGVDTAKIYHNGVFIAQEVNANNAGTFDAGGFNVGGGISFGGNFGGYGEGEVPVSKLYNRALTASEIKSNFNAIKGRFNIL